MRMFLKNLGAWIVRYAMTSASIACHTPKLAVLEGIMPVMSLIEKAFRLPLPEMVRIVL